jgi:hypothetical protein
LRIDARPGDGEAVGLEAEGLHELHVFFVAVVVIVGDVAGVSLVGLAGDVEKVSQMEGPRPSSLTAPST